MGTSKLIFFDCDSTLSSIEGVDELARMRHPGMLARCEALTNQAMNGAVPIEAIFGERLRLIRPPQKDLAVVGQRYIETVEPDAATVLPVLRAEGWEPVILSGGFRQAIRPLADHLGIRRVEAVDLFFDKGGHFTGYDESFPTTRSGGKPEVITKLRAELHPACVVMVGDGVSDLETMPCVDLFVGFGRYAVRPNVKAQAHHFIQALGALPDLLRRA